MENCTDANGSNCISSEVDQGSPGVVLACSIFLIAMGGVTFVLSVPTIIALCAAQAVAKALRVFLLNALVSGLLTNTLSAILVLISLVVFCGAPTPPLLLCRFVLWLYNMTSLTRSLSVVGFSIMMLVIVRYGKNVKALYIALSLCLVWGLSLLLTFQYLIPEAYAVDFVFGRVCLPVQDDTIIFGARLFLTVSHLTITALVPLVVCIAVPLIVLCYIKKHTVTGSSDYGKSAAKLGLFLVMGTLINSVGIISSSVLVYFSVRGYGIINFAYITPVISLYPTPILIIIFLKPVRDKMKALLKCKCIPNCWSAPKTVVRNQHQLQEQVYDSLILQQHE